MKIDRRKFYRALVHYPVQYSKNQKDPFISSYCGNISIGGMKILSSFVSYPGEIVYIKISYQTLKCTGTITIKGKVIHAEQGPCNDETGEPTYYIGIQFQELMEDQEAIIRRIIRTYDH